MQNLNLIDKNKSNIDYDIIKFNDGEYHIKFKTEVNRKDRVQVLTRISSMTDLFILMQVADILNRMEVEWAVIITYLMGMRMDRVITFNEAYTLKLMANTINDMHASAIYIVEPHSDKTLTLIKNSIAINNKYLEMLQELPDASDYIIVFPDAGAKARYMNDNITLPVLTCKKKRDVNTGALSGFEIENPEVLDTLPDGHDYKFFVLDDLCDGGGTFCGIAELLKKAMPNAKCSLAVTHAVNEKGFENVCKYYDYFYVTDSYRNWKEFVLQNDELCNKVIVVPTNPAFFQI